MDSIIRNKQYLEDLYNGEKVAPGGVQARRASLWCSFFIITEDDS